MEYLNGIMQFINGCGFPIAMCVLILLFAYKYIVPYIAEGTKSNKEMSQTLLLLNERMSNVEKDVDNIKDDVKDIKNKLK